MEVRALATDGVVLLDGEVVLLERNHPPHGGEWVLPGGLVERDERARAACRREVREEVGLDVEPVELVDLYDDPDRDPRGNVSAAYRCRPTSPGPDPGSAVGSPPRRHLRTDGLAPDGLRPRGDRPGRHPGLRSDASTSREALERAARTAGVHVLRGTAASVHADRAATAALVSRTRETGERGVRVWYPPDHVAFGRRDRTAEGYDRARRAAAERGYPTIERETGGRAVVFTGGVLAFVRTEPADPTAPAVGARYERVLTELESALGGLDVRVRRGEPPASFCPGTRSLQADGKIAGLAQRITRGVGLVGGVLVVRDADAVAGVLSPVYDALGVPFDPESVGSLAGAGREGDGVRERIEGALVGDATTTTRRVRDT